MEKEIKNSSLDYTQKSSLAAFYLSKIRMSEKMYKCINESHQKLYFFIDAHMTHKPIPDTQKMNHVTYL